LRMMTTNSHAILRAISPITALSAAWCSLAQRAKALMKQWKPRIILADLMLPDGNAYSLLDHMKEDDSLRHQLMHLIVMSGHKLAVQRETGL
jgi:CheY-like chemotaxis protein